MRRMYNENELKGLVHAYLEAHPEDLVASLDEQDIELGDVTCADLTASGDVAIAGDVSVKTISQAQANWSADFTLSASSLTALGLTYTNVYNRFEIIGNVLYIVSLVKATNETENQITIPSGTTCGWGALYNIPTSVGDLIYDFAGAKVSEVPSGDVGDKLVINAGFYGQVGATQRQMFVRLTHESQNSIEILLSSFQNTDIGAGKSFYIGFRTFLTLI